MRGFRAILRSHDTDLETIARIVGLCTETLKKYYGDALDEGHKLIAGKIGVVLAKATLAGNISATVRWLVLRGGPAWRIPKDAMRAFDGATPDEPGSNVIFYIPELRTAATNPKDCQTAGRSQMQSRNACAQRSTRHNSHCPCRPSSLL